MEPRGIVKTTMAPKLSILIPCYNVEKFVWRCVNSVVRQSLQDLEIILINDGSTDSTLTILKQLAQQDNRIKLIDKPNSGYGASMNLGLAHATGEYIGIVESDDFADLQMFERLYHAAKQFDVDLVKSDYWFHTTAANSDGKANSIPANCANKIVNPLEAPEVFLITPSIWSGIYKLNFLLKNNIRFLETPGASYQDTSFAFKCWLMANQVYLLDEAFLHYRIDNCDSSTHSSKKVFCICDECHEIQRYAQQVGKFASVRASITHIKYSTYRWNFDRLKFPLNWKFLHRFGDEFKADFMTGLAWGKLGKEHARLYRHIYKMTFYPGIFFVGSYLTYLRKLLKKLFLMLTLIYCIIYKNFHLSF